MYRLRQIFSRMNKRRNGVYSTILYDCTWVQWAGLFNNESMAFSTVSPCNTKLFSNKFKPQCKAVQEPSRPQVISRQSWDKLRMALVRAWKEVTFIKIQSTNFRLILSLSYTYWSNRSSMCPKAFSTHSFTTGSLKFPLLKNPWLHGDSNSSK